MTKSVPRKVAARKARSAKSKTSKRSAKARAGDSQVSGKVAAKLRNNVAAETGRESQRMTEARFDTIRRTQVPDSFRVLAERNVAQAREVYEGSKHTLEAVLDSWQRSFSAAGQGAAVLNRRFIDVAERNINSGFDLATDLAGARNLFEVMELQAAYWRKLFDGLQARQGERIMSSKARGPSRNQ
jgi:hypothetical protein